MSGNTIRNHGLILVLVAAAAIAGCDSGPSVPAEVEESGEPVYVIEGNEVRLDDGVYVGEDGTVSKLISAVGDLNSDELDDLAVILRLDSKGSGIFYYLNAFLADLDGQLDLVGTEFLGDRIKLDFAEIYGDGSVSSLTGVSIHPEDYGQLAVGYSTHAADQALAEDPALYLVKHWTASDGELVLLEDY